MVEVKKQFFSSPFNSYVNCFLDGSKISKFIELVSIDENSIAYVICCYYGVIGGIDTFFDDNLKYDRRFRGKIKVSNEPNAIDFVMYDAVVKKFAPLTCIKLENEKGSANIYPHELEELLGDPILFKVKKDCGSDSSGTIVVEVLDFLIDSNVMEIYLNPSHDAYSYNATADGSIKCIPVPHGDLNNVGSESYSQKLIIPSIDSNCPSLNEFIGSCEVKILGDLSLSKVDSTSIVIAWYHSVCEGVDMWYPNDNYSNEPRFRLKINVHDDIKEASFVLFDEQVKKLAVETSALLLSTGESSSAYPHELDTIYGDAILFKVTTNCALCSNNDPCYEVVDMLVDPYILDQFFEHFMPTFGTIDFVAGKLSPIEVYDACSSSELEICSEEFHYSRIKRKVQLKSARRVLKKASKRPKSV